MTYEDIKNTWDNYKSLREQIHKYAQEKYIKPMDEHYNSYFYVKDYDIDFTFNKIIIYIVDAFTFGGFDGNMKYEIDIDKFLDWANGIR